MFFHYLTLSFISVHTLNAIKSITVLSSTKMLFWKHYIPNFECYFERHTFDSNINSGKLVQKLSLEQFYFFSILNIYTCKHKIYNHQSYICIYLFSMPENRKKQKNKKRKKNNNNKNKNKNIKKRNYKFN